MSIVLENEEGGRVTSNIFPNGHIKFARFTVGTVTIEIHNPQDVNSANSRNVQIIGQNTGTTIMAVGAGTSQPVAPQSTILERSSTEKSRDESRIEEEIFFIKNMNGWLMTVATLLMSLAFTSGLNVPGGTWSDTKSNSSSESITQNTAISSVENYKFLIRTPRMSYSSANPPNTTDIIYICRNIDSTDDTTHTAGKPIIMSIDQYRYYCFLVLNVGAFAFSMSVIILLLFNKFPEHRVLSIRYLLVYAMALIAMVYVLGCAPKAVYVLVISALLLTCVFAVQFVWGVKNLAEFSWNAPPMQKLRASVQKGAT